MRKTKGWHTTESAALSVIREDSCGNERASNTLQTTALVNEVYLRLVDLSPLIGNSELSFLPCVLK